MATPPSHSPIEGLLLIDKPKGPTSFGMVAAARKRTSVRKIGHTGTLDPMASGLMVLLIGRNFTKKAGELQGHDKEYEAIFTLGLQTDTDDITGQILHSSPAIPTLEEIKQELAAFQGWQDQVPPIFCAKKIDGTPIHRLARKGRAIPELSSCRVFMQVTLKSYSYPHLELHIHCSKGCYIRSIARDLGQKLGCFATMSALCRTRIGPFFLSDATPFEKLFEEPLHTFSEIPPCPNLKSVS